MLLYGARKWKIQKKAHQLMTNKYPDFEIDFQGDYVDDGFQLMGRYR